MSLAIGGFAVSYRFATEKTVQRSRGISNLGWPFFIATLAILPAALLLLVLLLIPRQSPKQATQSQPARSVVNSWSGNALVVHCAGFSAGETITIFLTPSLSGMAGTRELIAVLAANAQGACDASPRLIDPELATRKGWLLVAQGVTPDSVASSPFIAVAEPQSREALAAPVISAVSEKGNSLPIAQSQELIAVSDPQSEPQPQAASTSSPDAYPTDTPYDYNKTLCLERTPLPNDVWCVEYYRDRDQDAYPIYVEWIPPVGNGVMINWRGSNWPPANLAGDMPKSNFRIVFTGYFYFPETRSYLFTLRLSGSARIKIGEKPEIDAYIVGSKRASTYRVPIGKGYHPVRLEYYLDGGTPSIYLAWTPDGNRNDYWLGRYYNNTNMDGPVTMIRQDKELVYSWEGSPGGDVQIDNFSVQWLRVFQVPRDGMTCSMSADDKVRVYVDGRLIPELSNWDGPNAWDKTVTLAAGRRFVEVHFVEQVGLAQIRFVCNPFTPTPTPTPSTY